LIHYLTVHYNDESWIDIQLQHIKHYTSTEFKVWAFYGHRGADNVEQVINKHSDKFHYLDHHKCKRTHKPSKRHWKMLDKLTKIVLNDSDTKDTDILVWLDSDSLIVSNIESFLKTNKVDTFSAVQRVENRTLEHPDGDKFPHPCFAYCTTKFWKEHNLSWKGDQQHKEINSRLKDTGSYLLCHFVDNKIDWKPIRLSSSLTHDQMLFVTYGGVVYHHGGATRMKASGNKYLVSRHDSYLKLNKVNVSYLHRLRVTISDKIYEDICNGLFIK